MAMQNKAKKMHGIHVYGSQLFTLGVLRSLNFLNSHTHSLSCNVIFENKTLLMQSSVNASTLYTKYIRTTCKTKRTTLINAEF